MPRLSVARVTSLRRHVVWLSAVHGLSFPTEVSHLVGYLQARAQEPATRGGLKAAHQAMRFFEEITAIPEQGSLHRLSCVRSGQEGDASRQRFRETSRSRRRGFRQEFWQLSRKSSQTHLCWWILAQCWGTLRFSDHRGLRPADVSLDAEGFVAKADAVKDYRQRQRSVDEVGGDLQRCFCPKLELDGYRLGKSCSKKQPLKETICCLSPTDGFRGCRRKELKYVIGSARYSSGFCSP